MNKEIVRGLDDFEASFNELGEFLNFLKEREENTERHVIPAQDLKFYTIEKCLNCYKTEEALSKRLGVPLELLDDTKQNTDIIVSWNRNPYLLGRSAWISLKNRMDIYGKGVDLLGAELQTSVLNKRFSQMNNYYVKVIAVDGKVRAVMSNEYSVIPASEVFEKVVQHIKDRFKTYQFIGGYVDHNIVYGKVLLPMDELNKLYNIPDTYTPGIIIKTSDTGYSANQIGPYWQDRYGRRFIGADDYIYMQHRGGNSLDELIKELPNLFAKYQNVVRKFAQLLQIEISSPVRVLRKACRKIGLPKKLTKLLVEQFEQNCPQKVTAYDICREILYAPSLWANSIGLEEKVGKAININYSLLDNDDDE